MEAILLIGLQGAGKSTFFCQRWFDTHVRINLDMLRTRHRERLLVAACLEAKQPYVVDNTNASREQRAPYLAQAKESGFRVAGYYLASRIEDCLVRNATRPPQRVVPVKGLLGTAGRLERPARNEGFDELFYVSIDTSGEFVVSEWRDEV